MVIKEGNTKHTNAEVLRAIYKANSLFEQSHFGQSIISNNTKALIEDCIKNSQNDDDFNKRFNAQLKPLE